MACRDHVDKTLPSESCQSSEQTARKMSLFWWGAEEPQTGAPSRLLSGGSPFPAWSSRLGSESPLWVSCHTCHAVLNVVYFGGLVCLVQYSPQAGRNLMCREEVRKWAGRAGQAGSHAPEGEFLGQFFSAHTSCRLGAVSANSPRRWHPWVELAFAPV